MDVNMPVMNGYEVCEQIKNHPEYQSLPVIFISALTESMDKVKAFSFGGVDYVTKPFQFEEVKARVDTHLRLHFLQRQLEEKTQTLAKSLEELRKLEALRDNLSQMLVHDLRSPLAGLDQGLSLVISNAQNVLDAVSCELLEGSQLVVKKLLTMITDLLDISRMESNKMPLFSHSGDLRDTIDEAIASLSVKQENRITWQRPQNPIMAFYDSNIVCRVIANLIANSMKYTVMGPILIGLAVEDQQATVSVTDTGPGIPLEFQNKIFDKFTQLEKGGESKKFSSGLGLAFCKLAIELQGGKIGVQSKPNQGSKFWFSLPVKSHS
jgi:signal transduction histidine kinase